MALKNSAKKAVGDKARTKALREKYQSQRPGLKQLQEKGGYAEPMGHGVFMDLNAIGGALKKARADANLSLSDLEAVTGIDRAALSRMENDVNTPSLATLSRYAKGLSKELRVILVDASPTAEEIRKVK